MALSVFGKTLTQRPATVRPITAPPTTGKILNRVPTLTRPLFAKLPTPLLGSRAFNPKPGTPQSSVPDKYQGRAISNVVATVRKPDRGASNVLQGAVLTMPDGSVGGAPVTPKPILGAISDVFNQIVAQGGNTNVRQTQISTLTRDAYLQRVRNRPVTAAIGNMKRRGMIQRQGVAYVPKPFPSTIGALEKAQLWRIKTGTPTGIVGDRATMYPTAHVGAVYTKTNAPLITNIEHVDSRIGGTALAAAPMPHPPATVAQPATTKVEAVGRAYAWASPDTTASSTGSDQPTLAQTGERWALLIGVGVLAFFLLKR